MDRNHQNNSKIVNKISKWSNDIKLTNNWEGRNLHLDEIFDFKNDLNYEWPIYVFKLLNLIVDKISSKEKLILFLYIDLEYSKEKLILNNLTFEWLINNISEYTPPSLNYTSHDYLKEFYAKELLKCEIDQSIKEKLSFCEDYVFFIEHISIRMKICIQEKFIFFIKCPRLSSRDTN